MTISWDDEALTAFGDAMEYIAGDSYAAAVKVAGDIEEALFNAANNPFLHPPDKYREDGDVLFRAFELHHFRISYWVAPDELVIVRFRHTKQQPLSY